MKIKNDFYVAYKFFDLYCFLTKQDLKNRFRGSYLGILWIVVHNLVFSLIAGLLWTKIFSIDPKSFIPFMSVGISIWTFISSAMTEGCLIFLLSSSYIKQLPLPHSIFIFRALLTNSCYFLISIITSCFILILFDKFSIFAILCFIPGLLILLIYFYATSGVMAYMGLRYRDLQHALPSIFSLLFIVTPVIYPPEILVKKGASYILYLNPFTSLIEVVRSPLLEGSLASTEHYIMSILMSLIMLYCKYFIEKKWRRFVPFWS